MAIIIQSAKIDARLTAQEMEENKQKTDYTLDLFRQEIDALKYRIEALEQKIKEKAGGK